jgi:hypothetical protein
LRGRAGEHRPDHPDDGGAAGMMAVRRIRAERSPNWAARLRQEHNTLLARMPPDTMRTGLARAAARGIQACGQKWHTSSAQTTRGAGAPARRGSWLAKREAGYPAAMDVPLADPRPRFEADQPHSGLGG